MIERLNRNNLDINPEQWEDAVILDSILLEKGYFRSDSGAKANEYINTAKLAYYDYDSSNYNKEKLAKITAALAVQKAILAICTCDQEVQSLQIMEDCCGLILNQGKMHSDLLRVEIETATEKRINTTPPATIINYRENLIKNTFIEALELIHNNTTEQLAIANDMSSPISIRHEIPLNMFFTNSLSYAGKNVEGNYPVWAKNCIGWMQRNPAAENKRLDEYLAVYEKTQNDLEAELSK